MQWGETAALLLRYQGAVGESRLFRNRARAPARDRSFGLQVEHEHEHEHNYDYLPSGVVTSVPAGGVNSKVEAGIAPRLSFE